MTELLATIIVLGAVCLAGIIIFCLAGTAVAWVIWQFVDGVVLIHAAIVGKPAIKCTECGYKTPLAQRSAGETWTCVVDGLHHCHGCGWPLPPKRPRSRESLSANVVGYCRWLGNITTLMARCSGSEKNSAGFSVDDVWTGAAWVPYKGDRLKPYCFGDRIEVADLPGDAAQG